MSSLQSLDIAARSATTVQPPDARHRPQVQEVAKLIDVSACIGCKACQVASSSSPVTLILCAA